MEKGHAQFSLGCTAQGIAVANGVTTLALLELMVEKKMLSRSDVRMVLMSGIDCLEPRTNVRTIAEAVHLMRDQMLPLFQDQMALRQAQAHRLRSNTDRDSVASEFVAPSAYGFKIVVSCSGVC